MTEPDDSWRDFYESVPAQEVSPRRPRRYGWKIFTVLVIAALALAGWQTARWWQSPPDYAPLPPVDVELVLPDRIGDRARNQEDELVSAASADVVSMNNSAGVIDTMAAFYGTHKEKDLIYVVAWRSISPSSAEIFDQLLEDNFDSGGAEIVHSEPVEAGPLGGWAECGDYRQDGEGQVFCAWADGGSRGVVIFLYTPLEKAKRQLPGIRAAVVRII